MGLVVLAAGASMRLGAPKQLLRIAGRSLLERAARTALGSRCSPVVVVLGANGEALYSEVAGLPLQTVENREWQEGMGSSIRTGLRTLIDLVPDLEAAIFMLCDQPLLTSGHLDRMVEVYAECGALVVASEYDGKLGVPALFDRAVFSQLLELSGAEGAKRVIAAYHKEAVRVPFPNGEFDIDTPADFERLCGIIANTAPSSFGE